MKPKGQALSDAILAFGHRIALNYCSGASFDCTRPHVLLDGFVPFSNCVVGQGLAQGGNRMPDAVVRHHGV
jgi:hypothetical protein